MDQIVFFWIGNNLSIPEYLVKSIKKQNMKHTKIIQVSDEVTETVEGVDKHIKKEMPKDLMTARLKAFSLIETENNNTIFCDADSLLINKFSLSSFNNGLYLMKRKKNHIINHMSPEPYPEFENKYIGDIMPFLFGAIIICRKKNFFGNLLEICKGLPSRFHRWYGDQLSLHIYYLDRKSEFSFFDQEKYMHIIGRKEKYPVINIKKLQEEGVIFVTFKGSKSKDRIIEAYKML